MLQSLRNIRYCIRCVFIFGKRIAGKPYTGIFVLLVKVNSDDDLNAKLFFGCFQGKLVQKRAEKYYKIFRELFVFVPLTCMPSLALWLSPIMSVNAAVVAAPAQKSAAPVQRKPRCKRIASEEGDENGESKEPGGDLGKGKSSEIPILTR